MPLKFGKEYQIFYEPLRRGAKSADALAKEINNFIQEAFTRGTENCVRRRPALKPETIKDSERKFQHIMKLLTIANENHCKGNTEEKKSYPNDTYQTRERQYLKLGPEEYTKGADEGYSTEAFEALKSFCKSCKDVLKKNAPRDAKVELSDKEIYDWFALPEEGREEVIKNQINQKLGIQAQKPADPRSGFLRALRRRPTQVAPTPTPASSSPGSDEGKNAMNSIELSPLKLNEVKFSEGGKGTLHPQAGGLKDFLNRRLGQSTDRRNYSAFFYGNFAFVTADNCHGLFEGHDFNEGKQSLKDPLLLPYRLAKAAGLIDLLYQANGSEKLQCEAGQPRPGWSTQFDNFLVDQARTVSKEFCDALPEEMKIKLCEILECEEAGLHKKLDTTLNDFAKTVVDKGIGSAAGAEADTDPEAQKAQRKKELIGRVNKNLQDFLGKHGLSDYVVLGYREDGKVECRTKEITFEELPGDHLKNAIRNGFLKLENIEDQIDSYTDYINGSTSIADEELLTKLGIDESNVENKNQAVCIKSAFDAINTNKDFFETNKISLPEQELPSKLKKEIQQFNNTFSAYLDTQLIAYVNGLFDPSSSHSDDFTPSVTDRHNELKNAYEGQITQYLTVQVPIRQAIAQYLQSHLGLPEIPSGIKQLGADKDLEDLRQDFISALTVKVIEGGDVNQDNAAEKAHQILETNTDGLTDDMEEYSVEVAKVKNDRYNDVCQRITSHFDLKCGELRGGGSVYVGSSAFIKLVNEIKKNAFEESKLTLEDYFELRSKEWNTKNVIPTSMNDFESVVLRSDKLVSILKNKVNDLVRSKFNEIDKSSLSNVEKDLLFIEFQDQGIKVLKHFSVKLFDQQEGEVFDFIASETNDPNDIVNRSYDDTLSANIGSRLVKAFDNIANNYIEGVNKRKNQVQTQIDEYFTQVKKDIEGVLKEPLTDRKGDFFNDFVYGAHGSNRCWLNEILCEGAFATKTNQFSEFIANDSASEAGCPSVADYMDELVNYKEHHGITRREQFFIELGEKNILNKEQIQFLKKKTGVTPVARSEAEQIIENKYNELVHRWRVDIDYDRMGSAYQGKFDKLSEDLRQEFVDSRVCQALILNDSPDNRDNVQRMVRFPESVGLKFVGGLSNIVKTERLVVNVADRIAQSDPQVAREIKSKGDVPRRIEDLQRSIYDERGRYHNLQDMFAQFEREINQKLYDERVKLPQEHYDFAVDIAIAYGSIDNAFGFIDQCKQMLNAEEEATKPSLDDVIGKMTDISKDAVIENASRLYNENNSRLALINELQEELEQALEDENIVESLRAEIRQEATEFVEKAKYLDQEKRDQVLREKNKADIERQRQEAKEELLGRMLLPDADRRGMEKDGYSELAEYANQEVDQFINYLEVGELSKGLDAGDAVFSKDQKNALKRFYLEKLSDAWHERDFDINPRSLFAGLDIKDVEVGEGGPEARTKDFEAITADDVSNALAAGVKADDQRRANLGKEALRAYFEESFVKKVNKERVQHAAKPRSELTYDDFVRVASGAGGRNKMSDYKALFESDASLRVLQKNAGHNYDHFVDGAYNAFRYKNGNPSEGRIEGHTRKEFLGVTRSLTKETGVLTTDFLRRLPESIAIPDELASKEISRFKFKMRDRKNMERILGQSDDVVRDEYIGDGKKPTAPSPEVYPHPPTYEEAMGGHKRAEIPDPNAKGKGPLTKPAGYDLDKYPAPLSSKAPQAQAGTGKPYEMKNPKAVIGGGIALFVLLLILAPVAAPILFYGALGMGGAAALAYGAQNKNGPRQLPPPPPESELAAAKRQFNEELETHKLEVKRAKLAEQKEDFYNNGFKPDDTPGDHKNKDRER